MAKKYPTDIRTQAQSVVQGWKAIGNTMVITDLTQEAMETEVHSVTPLLEEIDNMEARLSELRTQRDAVFEDLWKKVKRVRAGVKANYGDDSAEYKMIGGKRISDRKPAVRNNPPASE